MIAAFIALALSPPVNFLDRRMRRGFAIAIVYFGLLLVPIGIGALVVPPVVSQTRSFVDHGQLQKKAAELSGKVGSVATVLGDIGLGLVNSVFALVTILILAAFMLGSGPRWREGLLGQLPDHHAARWRGATDEIAKAVANYVGGALAQAVIAAVTSYVVMLILGIPFRRALAVLIGLFDLIPLVGATIAAVLVGIVTVFLGSRPQRSPG
ncbi:MAG: AI-2E family transporter [Solirubrobacteraceae bacterium]